MRETERGGETHTQRDRQRQADRQRKRDRQTETEKDKQADGQRQRGERNGEREGGQRPRKRKSEKERAREKDSGRARKRQRSENRERLRERPSLPACIIEDLPKLPFTQTRHALNWPRTCQCVRRRMASYTLHVYTLWQFMRNLRDEIFCPKIPVLAGLRDP